MTAPAFDDLPEGAGPEQLPGVSRTTAIDLVQRVHDLYADAERRLAADIARRLAAGQDSPQWAEDKRREAGAMRRQAAHVLARLREDTSREVTYALISAYLRGGASANAAVLRLGMDLPATPDAKLRALLDGPKSKLRKGLAELAKAFPGLNALMRMIRSLVLRINGTHLPVLRWADDIYRKVITQTALPGPLMGLETRRRASQKAWEQFLGEGVTGFTDRAGRRWNLASYVEMATRAGVVQAAVEGHLERLAANGLDYVIVSNAPQECAKCRPWEGKILAREGEPGPGVVMMESAIADEMVPVAVAGTVAEAILAGLMHPNCRHRFGVYLPGVTRIPTNTEDPEGDAAQQKLRGLERKVRKTKLLAETAFTPIAKHGYEAKVRALQAQIREHVKTSKHLGIVRKPEREQIHAAR